MAPSRAEFDDLLDLVPRLQARDKVSELSGGLTNRNLRVQTPAGDYVVRISSNESQLLAIDRVAEYENSKIAARVGVGASVYDFLPDHGVLVIGYLEGKTFSSQEVRKNLPRVAQVVKQLHSAERFVNNFNMFEIQKRYLSIVQENGFRIPQGYAEYAGHVESIKRALAVLDEGTVPCNNDLLAANFIDNGERLWLIDYEYSGNNDACFELGNIYSESSLSQEELEELVTCYYGQARPEKVARAWLYALLARYGWTLWASIQSSVSQIDFDFWEWGMAKYEVAQSDFASTRFEKALRDVTRTV